MRIASDEDLELSEPLRKSLVHWVWLTTYGEYFAGINYSKLRKTIRHLRSIVREGVEPRPPELVQTVRPWPRFDLRNARSRAILLRMAELDPLDSAGASQDSFSLLAEHGANAVPKLLTFNEVEDRKALEGVENRILVQPKEIGPLRRLLHSSNCDPKILSSHGIEEAAADALRAGEYREFLDLRRARLIEIEGHFISALGLVGSSTITV